MPEPVVTHIIGTAALLGVALLIVASLVIVQQVAYFNSLNVMLSEVAESCARELVELVSLQTLGGGEYTYMKLTLPPVLGDQPYNLSLENVAENTIMVKAQLQLLRQVKVVVTPNFGKAPVYAVSGVTRFGELIVTPYVLVPTPSGGEPALVAVRSRGAVYVGFTLQPPGAVSSASLPMCLLVNWSERVAGPAGSVQEIVFAVYNPEEAAGVCYVKVYNEAGLLVSQREVAVTSRGLSRGSLPVQLSSQPGTYLWQIVSEGPGPYGTWLVHSQAGVRVIAGEPRVEVAAYTGTLSGNPRSSVALNLTLSNAGNYPGTALVYFNGSEVSTVALSEGEAVNISLPVSLPGRPGTYASPLMVKTKETGYTESYTVLLLVRDPSTTLSIIWANSTVEGLEGWTAKIYVVIRNIGDTAASASIELNGSRVRQGINVNPGSSLGVSFEAALPSRKGTYKWNISLVSSSTLQDFRIANVIVKTLTGPYRSAFVWQSFNSTPSDWTGEYGKWTVDSGVLKGQETGEKGICSGKGGQKRCAIVYYWSSSISSYTPGFSAVVRIYFDSSDQGVYRGFALLSSDLKQMFDVAVFRAKNTSAQLLLEKLGADGSWTLLDTSSWQSVQAGEWYTLFLNFSHDGSTGYFTYELYKGNSLILAKSSRDAGAFRPNYLALFVDEKEGTFDDVVAASGDARYVKIYGLPAGWSAVLYSAGSLVATASSSGSGEVRLQVTGIPILKNAELVIRDPYGKEVLRQSFSTLLGGDEFRLVSS